MHVLSTQINQAFERQADEVARIAEESILLNDGSFINLDNQDFNLYKVNPSIKDSEIPNWNMVIDVKIDQERVYLIDTRPFENANRIHNGVEYRSLISRAIALHSWYEEPSKFQSIVPALTLTYINWMSGIVKGNYNLSELQLSKYEVMFGLYMYASVLLQADQGISGEEMLTGYRKLAGTLRLPPPIIEEVLTGDNEPILVDLLNTHFQAGDKENSRYNQLLKMANFIVGSQAMDMDLSALLTLCSKSWMGHNSAALSLTAVEHPAIFGVLISTALTNNLYRRTRIGQAVDMAKRRVDVESVARVIHL